MPKNLEIHIVFLRFFGIGSQKICSPICALQLLVQLLKYGAQVFRELDKVIQTKNREGGSIRQYCFDGKQCRDKSPLLIWPENPKPPKEGQSVCRLPFSIQGELELYAESSEKAYTTFGLFDSEDFLFHLLTLFQKNGIGAYLRPDEMKKAKGKADALIS